MASPRDDFAREEQAARTRLLATLGLSLFALALSGCTCVDRLSKVEPAALVVSPTALELPPTWVGEHVTREVTVTNVGGARALAELTVDAPFSVAPSQVELARGASLTLEVDFRPSSPGLFTAVLRVGTVEVSLSAEGLEVPVCQASGVCRAWSFDTTSAQCVEQVRPDDAACETACVVGGCLAGTCVGQLKGCDDHDLCTVDA